MKAATQSGAAGRPTAGASASASASASARAALRSVIDASRGDWLSPARFNFAVLFTIAATVALVGLYWAALDSSTQRLRAAATAQSEVDARRLANAIASQLDATLGGIDFALGYLRDRGIEDEQRFRETARVVESMLPPGALLQVSVVDERGHLLHTTLPGRPQASIADRDHFRVHLDPTRDVMYVSAPVLGRVSGEWTVQFSRKLLRDGHFAGVVVLSVSPRYLSRRMAQLGLDDDDMAGLIRDGGAFVARAASLDEVLGHSVPADRPFLQPGAPASGVFSAPSAVKPEMRRIFAWRRLENGLPLTAVVGLSESDALALAEVGAERVRGSAIVGSTLTLMLLATVIVLLLRLRARQQQLAESEESYRNLFEKNRSVKLLIDPATGAIVAANPAAAEFYGYPRETLESLNIADLNPLSPQQMTRELEAARRERRNHLRLAHRLASGRTREVEVYSGTLEMHGRPLLYAIVHDVTDRARLESLLRVGEARYRALFESVPDGVLLFDEAGGLLSCNRAATLLLGGDECAIASGLLPLCDADGQPLPPEQQPVRRVTDPRWDGGVYRAALPGGRTRRIAVRRRAMPLAADGEPLGALLSVVDLEELAAWREQAVPAGRGAGAA
ncbi:PAS domain S-box protein [Derxia gummosa]|uniref:PAS domain S-box protein n=1 Tax=Derxia gummosa DSM 723 TaxID=1121388 RepID=A0A8B6X8Z8_9BURK|nr:PAS domain S-box protein [Derxia gummosa]